MAICTLNITVQAMCQIQRALNNMNRYYFGWTKSCTTSEPWKDINAKNEWCPMVSKWCEMDFVHPQYKLVFGLTSEKGSQGCPSVAAVLGVFHPRCFCSFYFLRNGAWRMQHEVQPKKSQLKTPHRNALVDGWDSRPCGPHMKTSPRTPPTPPTPHHPPTHHPPTHHPLPFCFPIVPADHDLANFQLILFTQSIPSLF